jgi:hypothetical protein
MPVLNENQRQQVIAFVSLGCSQVTAARMANCSLADVEETISRHPELLRELVQAGCQIESLALKAIEEASAKNYRAACWLLERLYPERYAPRKASATNQQDVLGFLSNVATLVKKFVRDPDDRNNLLTELIDLGRAMQARKLQPKS